MADKLTLEVLTPEKIALRETVEAPTVNESSIRAAAAELARVEGDLAVARAHARQDLRRILTPEQASKLDQMKNEKDLFKGVDLLTLSACQTAAQRPDANGREVDGFAELAQRLGAGAVMASLWEVSDESTAELMSRFYRGYVNGGLNKADAIRQAQLALLKGEYKTAPTVQRQLTQNDKDAASIKIDPAKLIPFKPKKNAPYAHPYYWSPFVLIGNWK